MDIKDIEILDTSTSEEKRLIFYISDTMSYGFRVKRGVLYNLYCLLRDIFKDES